MHEATVNHVKVLLWASSISSLGPLPSSLKSKRSVSPEISSRGLGGNLGENPDLPPGRLGRSPPPARQHMGWEFLLIRLFQGVQNLPGISTLSMAPVPACFCWVSTLPFGERCVAGWNQAQFHLRGRVPASGICLPQAPCGSRPSCHTRSDGRPTRQQTSCLQAPGSLL